MIIVEESSDLCNYHKFSPAHRLAYAQDAPARSPIHRISIANYTAVRQPLLRFRKRPPTTPANVLCTSRVFQARELFNRGAKCTSQRNKEHRERSRTDILRRDTRRASSR